MVKIIESILSERSAIPFESASLKIANSASVKIYPRVGGSARKGAGKTQ
jgi:hypothetical protein